MAIILEDYHYQTNIEGIILVLVNYKWINVGIILIHTDFRVRHVVIPCIKN